MEKYPFNEDKFQVEVENIEGKRLKVDRTSEEYRIAQRQYNSEIMRRTNARIFDSLVQAHTPSKKDLLKTYADAIAVYRDFLQEGEDAVSDWQLLVDSILVKENEDRKALNDALTNQLPISDEEVAHALAGFRYTVWRVRPDDVAGNRKRSKKSQTPDDSGE